MTEAMGRRRARSGGNRSVAAVLAVLLYVSTPRRSRSEDLVDLKVLYYQEDKGRVSVFSPAFFFQREYSPTFGIRIDGIYNAISGATPTGAPPEPVTITRTTTAPTSPGDGPSIDERDEEDQHEEGEEDQHDRNGFNNSAVGRHRLVFMAGATPASGGGSGGGSRTVTEEVPTGEFTIPTAEVKDERYGLNCEIWKKIDRHALSLKASFSTESDYLSQGIAVSDGISFNDRNTVLTLGLAYTYDRIDVFSTGRTADKATIDALVGLSQLLDKKTRLTVNVAAGTVSGFMSDPYKVVELNGTLVPESRPDDKDRRILFVSLLRYLELLNASVEASYRFYDDSFGIRADTYGLAWRQKVGPSLTVGPRVRFYNQTQADFYEVRFQGTPEFYSADYRVSALQSTSFGAEVSWAASKTVALSLAYDRYEQDGRDGKTDPGVYPSANAMTLGGRIWF